VDACFGALLVIADTTGQVIQEVPESDVNYYGSPMGRVEGQEEPSEEDYQSQELLSPSYIEPGQRYAPADSDAIEPLCSPHSLLGPPFEVTSGEELNCLGGESPPGDGPLCLITGSDNSGNIDAFYDVLNLK